MNWIHKEDSVFCSPYSIHRDVRGFSAWYKRGDKFGVLGKEIQTLEKAKQFCADHAAKEAALLKSLEAVSVK